MKVSKITFQEIADYIRLSEVSEEEKTLLDNLINIAKSFIKENTGVQDLDEYDDFVIVIFILCQDMYDNRTLYVDKTNLNKVVETILGLHSRNNIISIFQEVTEEDKSGFKNKYEKLLLTTWANVKTTKGFTLIANNSDFEKAYTNFTIRYPKTKITRDMVIEFNSKKYTIEYLNNVDEENVELEIQAKEVTK